MKNLKIMKVSRPSWAQNCAGKATIDIGFKAESDALLSLAMIT